MTSTIEKLNTLEMTELYVNENIYVFIIHSSIIVREGLISILSGITEQIKLYQFEHLDRFENWIGKKQFGTKVKSIIFISNDIKQIPNFGKVFSNKIIISIAVNSSIVNNHILNDYSIDINDNEEKIRSIIEKVIHSLADRNTKEEVELSEREKEVLSLLVLGHSNKEIADKLCISTHTVISHRKNLTRKLGIKSVAGLTVYAIINKMVDPDSIKLSDLI